MRQTDRLERVQSIRHVSPTAVRVEWGDLWHGVKALLKPDSSLGYFRSALMESTGSRACHLLGSGRAALTVILSGLKRLSQRSKVIVPAYGCPTVVQAVLHAGLEPVFCDVSFQTLDLDREELGQLIDCDPLAVMPVHLYGLAQDVRDLITLGQERGFFVIEDAAQALGATFSGQMVGTWGDAGIYSLGRGKCLPAGSGGVIIAGERCSQAISDAMAKSVHASRSWDIASLLMFAGYGLATHPRGWWFVARTSLNPSADGMNVEALPPIRVAGLSPVLAGIGTSILERLKEVQSVNKKNAQHLMEQLAHFTFASFPRSAPEAQPVFLRLPVILERKEQAGRLFAALQQQGIGVSRSYYHTLPDLFSGIVSNGRRQFPGALRLAECMLTLPTHSYLERDDFSRIVKAFHMIDTKENMDHASTTA